MVHAIMREWHDDLGWDVIDSPETAGGCWAHFTAIDAPIIGYIDGAQVSEYRGLCAGDSVELLWETPGQDGFNYRAIVVERHP